MVQPYSRLSKIPPVYITGIIFAIFVLLVHERTRSARNSNRSVMLKQSIEKIVLTKKTPSQVNIMRAIKQDEVFNLIICKV